ncbi:MAG: hypothetical protein BGP13_22775 [Sphingobacteriales bacterium 40-81]|nr:MAG: hypothetical protein BGP13_22775 [Sphingobacteriales bacterium 40-81]
MQDHHFHGSLYLLKLQFTMLCLSFHKQRGRFYFIRPEVIEYIKRKRSLRINSVDGFQKSGNKKYSCIYLPTLFIKNGELFR